ncbi:TadE/TadG family type IV pilus assembly protein [Consotaella aegiceratis]|uniref:TadE/TadG family type IV pilus assembly protein n=1 Tax=Consotaella aegiceratis TaxID=3097961 RepID=UPI002F4186E6
MFDRFAGNARGNFAVITALLAVPLIFAIGAAIDLARIQNAQSALQDAVDGAALAVLKDADFDEATAYDIANRMIQANYSGGYQNLKIEFTTFGAVVSADTEMPAALVSIVGIDDLISHTSATVEYPPTKFEIALVLDTTGSMRGQKITELKKAAKAMIADLTTTEMLRRRMRFAVVPFSAFVNVGASNADADWLDTDGLNAVPYSVFPVGIDRLKVFQSLGASWKGCVEARTEHGAESYSTDDTEPTSAKPRTLFVPLLAPDEPDENSGKRYSNSYLADGAGGLETYGITKDQYGAFHYNEGNTAQVDDANGLNSGCLAPAITPLTERYDDVTTAIDHLVADGNTNITEGVAWGQRVLSPEEPFTEGLSPKEDVQKIIILLTDGDNHVTLGNNELLSDYTAYGYIADGRWDKSYKSADTICADGETGPECRPTPSQPTLAEVIAEMNEDTQAACTAAKSSKTEIYAIRLEVDTKTSSDLLQGCATQTPDSPHYYDAREAEDLEWIFDDIANRIKQLRITS